MLGNRAMLGDITVYSFVFNYILIKHYWENIGYVCCYYLARSYQNQTNPIPYEPLKQTKKSQKDDGTKFDDKWSNQIEKNVKKDKEEGRQLFDSKRKLN